MVLRRWLSLSRCLRRYYAIPFLPRTDGLLLVEEHDKLLVDMINRKELDKYVDEHVPKSSDRNRNVLKSSYCDGNGERGTVAVWSFF